VTNINTTGTNTVQLNGDIRFDYSTLNSYTKVDATVNLKLTNSDSFLNGNILVAGNPPTGKDTVLDMNLTLANGGTWSATDDSFVNRLTLDGGVIRITESDAKIDVLNEFAGNGTVVLAAEKTQDGGFTAAGFALASAVKPSEDSSLAITYSGITSDDVDDVETAFNELNENVSTTGVKQTRTIAEGDIIGKITQTVDAEGNTVSSSVAKNTKLDAFEGVNAATLMAWRNEINHLTKRLGDVRDEASSMGAWARVYGGESTYSDAVDVEVDQTTVQVGLDGRVGSWIVGGAFSYANGDADITNGEADTDGYTFALYGTRFFESGAYVDAVARVGRLSTDVTAGDMKGSYDNNAFSLSAEVGHNFKFLERAFVEPQFELTYGYVTGDDFSPKAGVKIEQDDFQMLIALGARVGWQFERNAGGLYAQASVNHDFLGDADGEASEGALHQDLNADLGGTWLTYGVGFQFRPTDKTAFYGELERSTGGEVKDHYTFNVGARYAW
jgi:outer membrane autotransporter protein